MEGNPWADEFKITHGDGVKTVYDWADEVRAPPKKRRGALTTTVEMTHSPDKRFDLVLIDVDASEAEAAQTGLAAPPAAFLSESFLSELSTILDPLGTAVFNILPRVGAKPSAVPIASKRLEAVFAVTQRPAGGSEHNVVAFCAPNVAYL